jgi:molybdopterin/thiamine biosynthesis adenylyltransferase
LNDEQLLRYARHIMLPDIDIEGQEKLLAARVFVVGLGGLGSPVALYLAASGVGSLTLADFELIYPTCSAKLFTRRRALGNLRQYRRNANCMG